ncbi:MAG: hypothetical protein AB7I18_04615 [Candidatus Berkiella sp.]
MINSVNVLPVRARMPESVMALSKVVFDSYSCTLSYAQLSHCIYQPHEAVHRALKRLLALGFLECEGLLEAFTPLTLDEELNPPLAKLAAPFYSKWAIDSLSLIVSALARTN